jgi:hypothetical protein
MWIEIFYQFIIVIIPLILAAFSVQVKDEVAENSI